jgi:predicted Mrr-cat superfamily restriction endonuclease
LKTAPKIAIGEITGPCTPTTDGHPMRPVRWLKAEVPRDVFRQDLLYSFGAFMTVCEISRNDALQRVEAVIKTGRDPGYESGSAAPRDLQHRPKRRLLKKRMSTSTRLRGTRSSGGSQAPSRVMTSRGSSQKF